MKLTTVLTGLALFTLACGQGGQTQPPPPAASANQPAAAAAANQPAAAAPASAPVAETATAAPAPKTGAARSQKSEPAAPASEPPKAVAPRAESSNAAASAAPARVRLDIPKGTVLPLEIQTEVSTAHSHEGDPVLAVLTEDVPLKGFKLDKGAEVRGEVRIAVSARRVKGRAHLVVGFDSVMKNGEKIVVETETIDSMAKSTKSKDTKIIAGAAAAGLLVGAIKDGGKGAAIGTLVGAAAGTGAVLVMKGDEVEIPRGAKIGVTVTK